MELRRAVALISAFRNVPRRGPIRPTIMELSGYPHYENVCSNILAFFLDPSSPHGLDSLCLDALLETLNLQGSRLPLSNVTVEREVRTKRGNSLDILVTSDSHVLAIENKLFARPYNPFADYAELAAERAGNDKFVYKILLALSSQTTEPGGGFVYASYSRFIQALRSRLGYSLQRADPRCVFYLSDLLDSIENLQRGTQMDAAWLDFIRDQTDDVTALLGRIRDFKTELRSQVQKLGSMIDVPQKTHVRQWFYRESQDLSDYLVHDIEVAPDLKVVVDTIISPQGWKIELDLRDKKQPIAKLVALLQSLRIPFEYGERLVYPSRYGYDVALDSLRSHLQPIVSALSDAKADQFPAVSRLATPEPAAAARGETQEGTEQA